MRRVVSMLNSEDIECPCIQIPSTLRSSMKRTLNPCPPTLDEFTWTVKTDLVATVDSVNFRTFSSIVNPDFIDADVHKGIVVPAYARLQVIDIVKMVG